MVKFSYWYPAILGIGAFSLIYWGTSEDLAPDVLRLICGVVVLMSVFFFTENSMRRYREKRKNEGVETKE